MGAEHEASQSPSSDLVAVTPHDTNFVSTQSATDDGRSTRGIYVGGAGNLSVVTRNGQTVTLTGVLAGSIYPIQARKIRSTSTTATNLVALL